MYFYCVNHREQTTVPVRQPDWQPVLRKLGNLQFVPGGCKISAQNIKVKVDLLRRVDLLQKVKVKVWPFAKRQMKKSTMTFCEMSNEKVNVFDFLQNVKSKKWTNYCTGTPTGLATRIAQTRKLAVCPPWLQNYCAKYQGESWSFAKSWPFAKSQGESLTFCETSNKKVNNDLLRNVKWKSQRIWLFAKRQIKKGVLADLVNAE